MLYSHSLGRATSTLWLLWPSDQFGQNFICIIPEQFPNDAESFMAITTTTSYNPADKHTKHTSSKTTHH